MLAAMDLDSSEIDDGFADRRLHRALYLLEKPERKPPSLWMALLASTGLAGAALLLAVTMVFEPGTGVAAGRTPTNAIAQPSASLETSSADAPAFELSGSSLSASAIKTTPISGSEGQ